jgi:hypothetical protein
MMVEANHQVQSAVPNGSIPAVRRSLLAERSAVRTRPF